MPPHATLATRASAEMASASLRASSERSCLRRRLCEASLTSSSALSTRRVTSLGARTADTTPWPVAAPLPHVYSLPNSSTAAECVPKMSAPAATWMIVGFALRFDASFSMARRLGASSSSASASSSGSPVTADHDTGTNSPELKASPVPRAPSVPSPQVKTPPNAVTMTLCRDEHAICSTGSRGSASLGGHGTRRGSDRPVSTPSPRHPKSLRPHDHSDVARYRASSALRRSGLATPAASTPSSTSFSTFVVTSSSLLGAASVAAAADAPPSPAAFLSFNSSRRRPFVFASKSS
mmetsp:Transcript_43824/g.137675  ORF Transcript_43824/g.137675 Transcript_43824/m.137675 type:complete len:294 (-) Transcript_43824:1411-2292(-)